MIHIFMAIAIIISANGARIVHTPLMFDQAKCEQYANEAGPTFASEGEVYSICLDLGETT
jgi:hypothetical protein